MSTNCIQCGSGERTAGRTDLLCDTCREEMPMTVHLRVDAHGPLDSCMTLFIDGNRCGHLTMRSTSQSQRFIELVSRGCNARGDKFELEFYAGCEWKNQQLKNQQAKGGSNDNPPTD